MSTLLTTSPPPSTRHSFASHAVLVKAFKQRWMFPPISILTPRRIFKTTILTNQNNGKREKVPAQPRTPCHTTFPYKDCLFAHFLESHTRWCSSRRPLQTCASTRRSACSLPVSSRHRWSFIADLEILILKQVPYRINIGADNQWARRVVTSVGFTSRVWYRPRGVCDGVHDP